MIRELSEHEIDALHYELLVKDIVAAAEKLPPFPDVAWKVSSMVKAMAPVKEIEAIIKYDQVMMAKILKLGNSAYYGRQGGVSSLKDAILLLGNKRLIQVVVTACALRYFNDGSREDRRLWEHSITAALMSEIVSRRLSFNGILTLYTATLLHDIGNTVLNLYFKIYRHTSQHPLWGGIDVVKAERRAVGIDHQELGGIIARNWKFPADITTAIEHHHDPEKAGKYAEIASLVYLSDLLATPSEEDKEGQWNDRIDPEKDPVFKKLGITRKMIGEFRGELGTGMKSVMEALSPGP